MKTKPNFLLSNLYRYKAYRTKVDRLSSCQGRLMDAYTKITEAESKKECAPEMSSIFFINLNLPLDMQVEEDTHLVDGKLEKQPLNPSKEKENTIDPLNRFSESKKFIQNIADVALMMANISQLRAVLGLGDKNEFYIPLITLIILSLVSHTLFVFITVIRGHFIRKHQTAVRRAVKKSNSPVTNAQPTENNSPSLGGPDANKSKVETGNVGFCCCCVKKERIDEYSDTTYCQCPHCHTDLYLGYLCFFFVFITICANIGITGIGISGDCKS
ncbi:unnamed protein product [Mytilus coruscus]|uniref:Uncharacterized protein n=1 Tax=Mytilus coruscus TaxID=42192 RepID=A0A6J8DQ73_MYTCO|nr:unnamed protein product [Mytilus coruscus]